MVKKHPVLKYCIVVIGVVLIGFIPTYFLAKTLCYHYFDRWGDRLVDLERRGLLSKVYGAGWQDILTEKAMVDVASVITEHHENNDTADATGTVRVVDGVMLAEYPSLSIINHLREVRVYSNTIDITDRLDRHITGIRTDHHRARIPEFPQTLLKALVAAEDENFRKNNHGFEVDSFLRAALRAILKSVTSFKIERPRGTSTITQQVAKLFISSIDDQGFRRVSRSFDRKLREIRIAAALRKMYTPDDILEVYCNHCVTSDYGMIGFADIADGLFGKKLSELSDAECIYLSRMVKWGRNVKTKIVGQCKIDMPRMGTVLGWDAGYQKTILAEIDSLTFRMPQRFEGSHNSLIDLANEYWLLLLRKIGTSSLDIEQMNLIDPNSLIRKKGNLQIRLSIDRDLQTMLESLVDARGYGPDTSIIDEVRIGSSGSDVKTGAFPRDTLRILRILDEPIDFNEPGSAFITSLNAGDTVYTNIRYRKGATGVYRRSVFHYVRKQVIVNGQYFSYSLMDASTGKLLAYYSKDRVGSRLRCLLKNRTPNGSSTVKPIMNALNFDMGVFQENSLWTDTLPVYSEVPWKRDFYREKGKTTGVVFALSSLKNVGYVVHNHNDVFDGCKYVFEHLTASNNILGVETMYRLNRKLFGEDGTVTAEGFPVVRLFSRIGSFSRIKDSLKLSSVTGVRVYKEICRIAGVNTDTIMSLGTKMPLSDSMFSVALGTLEMTLYEQMHLFNVFYNNSIIERPSDKPSLVIESVVLNGDTVSFSDTIKRYHPFSDINAIRPTLLGMHNRLTGNPADGLLTYDVEPGTDSMAASSVLSDSAFADMSRQSSLAGPEMFVISRPLSNFAKSGTTDDVIRPFNVDASSKIRTNYGLWNAVIRLDFSKISGNREDTSRIHDVTVACIGECSEKYTGPRDGKTLHKFLTTSLLKQAGVPFLNGYFKKYEEYLRSIPVDDRFCLSDSLVDQASTPAAGVNSSKAFPP